MRPWNVKSGIKCPICGKELELMSGSFYYEFNLGLVNLECEDCHLEIKEYSHHHGYKDGQANSYWPIVHALIDRVKKRRKDK